jgi:hypothetical protein
MILALDEDIPAGVGESIRAQEAVIEMWPIRLGRER